MLNIPKKHKLLVVDDEPDIYTVTKLSLKGLKYNERRLEILAASSGQEALDILRGDPQIGVVLLDVVMETDSAGLDACRRIREELGNRFVRILLRTGQPGAAPERETIEGYDIDGYLPKEELTSNRLYTAVRTALKAWEELIELERHRSFLLAVHECVLALHAFESLPSVLQRVLESAAAMAAAPLTVLYLETLGEAGATERYQLHLSREGDPLQGEAAATELVTRLKHQSGTPQNTLSAFDGGWVVPIVLHRELGYGWLAVTQTELDDLARKALALLATHAQNALYATVAQTLLAERDQPLFEAVTI